MQSQAKTALFKLATAALPYEEVFVKTDTADLYCRVMGTGSPLIVVHGGPGLSMNYLLPGLEELAKDHLVIFYDQRGNGKSTGQINNENMNLEKFAEDLQAIQNHFNLKKAGFVGHSFGVYLVLKYATEHPDRINKLLLLNSIPISFSENKSTSETKQDPYEAMIDGIIKSDAFKDNNAQGLIKRYKDLFQYFFFNPELVNKLNLDKMSADQVKNSALIHKLFEENFFHQPHDLRNALTKLKDIPTLIVHGSGHDIPESVAREIHSLIENSVLTILNSGHFPYVEKPNELFESISKFNEAYPTKNADQYASHTTF
ncbi:MAG: hypothetical protein A3F11_02195 [Gammaproteobacteria bacterium RIFCSPHIGHO2_12_FULL_37_14]|nr:MAG: hypothetical protein A3F11_02195 [Gammaproteobacteria bacterium RIFCSPHIGHO2_12_FULL_37_14]